MNYPITKHRRSNKLTPTKSTYSDEYAARMCDLYLSDEMQRIDGAHVRKLYRLHAKYPHSIEDALAYDIKCPNCNEHLKQIGRMIDNRTLGLYICPACDREKNGGIYHA